MPPKTIINDTKRDLKYYRHLNNYRITLNNEFLVFEKIKILVQNVHCQDIFIFMESILPIFFSMGNRQTYEKSRK